MNATDLRLAQKPNTSKELWIDDRSKLRTDEQFERGKDRYKLVSKRKEKQGNAARNNN